MFSLGLGKNDSSEGKIPPHLPLSREEGRHEVKMKLTENGVKFRSPYDGSKHEFTPEGVVDIQCNL